jgi:hypothetical protein
VIGAWLYHILGLRGTGPFYAFLSGALSVISELTAAVGIVGGAVAVLRRMVKHHHEQMKLAADHHEALKAHLSGLLGSAPASTVDVHMTGIAKAVAGEIQKLAREQPPSGGMGGRS